MQEQDFEFVNVKNTLTLKSNNIITMQCNEQDLEFAKKIIKTTRSNNNI